MTINQEPEVTRSHKLDYVIRFEGARHTLSRFIIKHEGALTFDYMSDLSDYMYMFLESINASDSDWTLGELETVEPFALNFDQVDHLSALYMIAEAAGCEVGFNGKEISIRKTIGIAHNYPLSYGKDNGLYKIRRVSLENSKIVTRAYAVGGSQNLPQGYEFKKMTLSGYLDDVEAQAIYGIREGVIEDAEIYPQRTNAATGVGQVSDSQFAISDDTIDFDLNGQRIEGTEAYIVFKSGMLNGLQFKILSYNSSSKTISYEANGGLIPFGSIMAEIGDEYTLVGIRMPESYVTNALNQLADKRLEYLNSNKVPRVVYDAQLDPLDLKRKAMDIKAGDILPFTDAKIGLNDNLRVTSVRYSATFPEFLFNGNTYEIEVGNEVTYNRIQKIEKDIKETKQVVTQYSKQSWESERVSAMRMRQLQELTFDPDGYFDVDRIKPLSIETMMLSVGAKSQNFYLNGVSFEANAVDDANKFIASAGHLIHREIEITGLGYIWNIDSFEIANLDPLKHYYLSARCSSSSLTGVWHLSEVLLKVDHEVGYLHFNVGVLYAVADGKRDNGFTYGMTYINGSNITTGKISADRIDVSALFAQEITATNLTVTGNSRIGNFSIIPTGLFAGSNVGSGGIARNQVSMLTTGFITSYLDQGAGFPVPLLSAIDMATVANVLARFEAGQGSTKNIGVQFAMDDTNIAIDILSGKVRVGGSEGATIKQAISTPEGTRYLNFKKGIMVGVTNS